MNLLTSSESRFIQNSKAFFQKQRLFTGPIQGVRNFFGTLPSTRLASKPRYYPTKSFLSYYITINLVNTIGRLNKQIFSCNYLLLNLSSVVGKFQASRLTFQHIQLPSSSVKYDVLTEVLDIAHNVNVTTGDQITAAFTRLYLQWQANQVTKYRKTNYHYSKNSLSSFPSLSQTLYQVTCIRFCFKKYP